MSKFKVGDRVAVYTCSRRFISKVAGFSIDGCLELGGGELEAGFAHPKQCRLLKKKTKRRVWVEPDALMHPNDDYVTASTVEMAGETGRWIEFVEVKKK